MRIQNTIRFSAVLAALCLMGGCKSTTENTETETTTTEIPVITTTAETTTAQTTTTTEESDEFVPKYEVDHIDDNDIYIYKNPEVWTYEELFENLTINGRTFEPPLTLEKLGENFTIDYDNLNWDEEEHYCGARLFYNETEFASVFFFDINNADELKNEEIDAILQIYEMNTSDKNIDVLKINNMGIGTHREELEASYGTPYGEQEWILTYFNEGLTFLFAKYEADLPLEIGEIQWIKLDFTKFPKENQQ
ncbi:MAG: hypothetical protein IKK53_02445 [Ruminiclostridium sp.]|nr:hypothetical protein [Ruminiclostridium sp.]